MESPLRRRPRISPADAYDAVVVGAGPNGLVAANMLVDAGWRVVVVEAEDEPGGAVRSAYDHPATGYTADLFSAFYPLAAASPVLSAMRLDQHGLEWTHAPAVLGHAFDDGRAAVLHRDVERTAASVDAFAPGDGDRWRAWVDVWDEIEQPVLDALLGPFPPARPALTLLRRLGVPRALRLARVGVLPVRQFTAEEFRGDGATMLLAGNAMHTDLGPESAASAIYGLLLVMLGQRRGFPLPRGGAGRLTDALVARLHAHGGELVCGAPATTVLLDADGAAGVEAGGRQYRARCVLADVPAPFLYRDLVGEHRLPPRLRRDVERFAWDNGTVKVNWALSGTLPWRNPDLSGAGTVHMGGGLDELSRLGTQLATGAVPERPFVLLGQMTTADPTRSPEGTESVWAYAHLPQGEFRPDVIEGFVGRIEAELDRHAPGFRDLVVGRSVQSPADLEAADAGLPGGALGGGTSALHQQLVLRPTPGLGRPDTFVPGLFLASSSAHPGGGVHGVCGANAARAALLRARFGRAYDGTVGRAQRYLSTGGPV